MANRPDLSALTPLDLKKKVAPRVAAEWNDISEDTFRRHYPHLIRRISPRRDGVEVGEALAIGLPKD
jgi:hypothetical protein